MAKDDDCPEYGVPDGEQEQTKTCTKMDQLEPVLLPRQPLQLHQFGAGSIKGGRLKHLSRKHEAAVLEACSVSANLSQACKRAGVSDRRVRTVMEHNPAFKARVKEHLDYAIDRLEQASLRRAMVGSKRVHEVLDREGNPVQLTVQDPPSDRLAIKILESRRPEVYGKRDSGPGSTHVTNIALVPRAELERIAEMRTIKVETQQPTLPDSVDKPKT